jgi:hypothetical protein
LCFPRTPILRKWPAVFRLRAQPEIHLIGLFIAPLNPRRPTIGPATLEYVIRAKQGGQTSRPNSGTLSPSEDGPHVTRAQRRTRT